MDISDHAARNSPFVCVGPELQGYETTVDKKACHVGLLATSARHFGLLVSLQTGSVALSIEPALLGTAHFCQNSTRVLHMSERETIDCCGPHSCHSFTD